VTVVLPQPVLRQRLSRFKEDFAFSVSGDVVKGYTFDMPMMVTTLASMPFLNEPVIVNVDAGYFGWGESIPQVVMMLRKNCPDIRQIIISDSRDEPEVDRGARAQLNEFEKEWIRGL
jgi:hypothetical protein